MRYLILSDWEHNGYSDSDFYRSYWDTEEETVTFHMYDTTRAGGTCSCDICTSARPITAADGEALEGARLWLVERLFHRFRALEESRIMRPDNVQKGQRVRLLETHRNVLKECDEEACKRCNGSGEWINPYDDSDVRTCFGCNGEGVRRVNWRKVKHPETGKTVYVTFEPGVAGEVRWVGTYRKIYRNGYNKRNRQTLETRIRLDDGRELKAPLRKLRLDEEMPSDEELREQADLASWDFRFGRVSGNPYAWDTSNAAAKAARERFGASGVTALSIRGGGHE